MLVVETIQSLMLDLNLVSMQDLSHDNDCLRNNRSWCLESL